MRALNTINALASVVGLLVLVALVSFGASLLSPWERYWVVAIAGYLFTVPMAVAAWAGVLFRRKGQTIQEPQTWRDWVLVFAVSLGVSLAFVFIDLAVRHPGISLVFTIGAICLTLIALPSAVRAWLLERWNANRSAEADDA